MKIATRLTNIGSVLQKLGKNSSAIKLTICADLLRVRDGGNAETIVRNLRVQGTAYLQQGKLAKAGITLSEALKESDDHWQTKPDHPEYVDVAKAFTCWLLVKLQTVETSDTLEQDAHDLAEKHGFDLGEQRDLAAAIASSHRWAGLAAEETIELDLEAAQRLMKLIEALEDDDDVQSVTANFEVSDEVMAQL